MTATKLTGMTAKPQASVCQLTGNGLLRNDGMGGGNSITQNLMFNWVRETSDHGASSCLRARCLN